jgi:predicted DCC family thiol-disulfide oxidoreductase YuxK
MEWIQVMTEIIVIFDGDCNLCKRSVAWLERELTITALPFQSSNLNLYGLTTEQCSKEVFAISEGKTYSGAAAVVFLLKKRGNSLASTLLHFSGPVGKFGYRWVASHRSSLLVRILGRIFL